MLVSSKCHPRTREWVLHTNTLQCDNRLFSRKRVYSQTCGNVHLFLCPLVPWNTKFLVPSRDKGSMLKLLCSTETKCRDTNTQTPEFQRKTKDSFSESSGRERGCAHARGHACFPINGDVCFPGQAAFSFSLVFSTRVWLLSSLRPCSGARPRCCRTRTLRWDTAGRLSVPSSCTRVEVAQTPSGGPRSPGSSVPATLRPAAWLTWPS